MAAQSDPRLDQARQLLRDEQAAEARNLLVSMLKDNPNNVEALVLFARVARTPQEAEKALRRALELDPLNIDAKDTMNRLLRPTGPLRIEPEPPSAEELLRASQSGNNRLFLLTVAVLLAIIILGGGTMAVLMLAGEEDKEPSEIPVAEATRRAAETGIVGEQEPSAEASLPPTWTQESPATLEPTRTLAPTMTPLPTRTLYPTPVPTDILSEPIALDLNTYGRLYYGDFYTLAAQAAWTTDAEQLQNIDAALIALSENIEAANYQEADLPEGETAFLDNFVLVIAAERNLLADRLQALERNAEATPAPDSAYLEQRELVEAMLSRLSRSATATVAWENAIDTLRTPTSTPIVLTNPTPEAPGTGN